MADSPEYHAAHLAFARASIVQSAARGQRILDLLKTYTEDVIRSVEDIDVITAATPRCQHCPCTADERSFMCEDCAGQADAEAVELRDALEVATKAVQAWDQWLEYLSRIEYQLRGHAPFGQAMEELRAAVQGERR